MASTTRLRQRWVRPIVTFTTLVFAAGGLVALEHTATGATTGKPSQTHAVSKHDDSKHDDSKHEGDLPRHCTDGHGKDNVKNKHCRPASGD